ncbi:metallophosphoesterase family protein [Myxococcota bacterium]|nr:metallophosphoesterase family protein [Myxococcota bacterium]
MQLAVLSDLHLGRNNGLDRFARRDTDVAPRFVRLLRHLERHVDLVVLLGDIFETLKGPRPGSARDELRATLETYPEIARRAVGHPKYRLVFGNHDPIAKTLGATEWLDLEDGSTRLTFFHGHQLDPLTRGRAWLSQAGVFLGGWLERLGLHVTPEDHARSDGPAWRSPPGDFERRAVELGRARGADVVVTGHTHRAVKRELGDVLYLNSGTCVAGRREHLVLDTSTGLFDVVHEPALV